MSQLTPVSTRERVATLDVLRGFALCGVLIANLYWAFSGRMWRLGPTPHGVIEHAADWIEDIFVSSKAQTMLTFLFGFGFAAQLLRAQDRREPVMAVYLRRLAVLFCVGALHVTLLWWGDVTWGYAIAGFGLLAFQRASNRTRLIAAAILIFVPPLVLWIPGFGPAVNSLFVTPADAGATFKAFKDTLVSPRYADAVRGDVRQALVFSAVIYASYFPWLVGRFLIGYVAGTQRWFDHDGADHLALFRRMLRWGLAGAIAGTAWNIFHRTLDLAGYELTTAGSIAGQILHEVGLLGLTATYMAVIVLLMQRAAWRRVLQWIAPLGRMPLTTYIAQSAICAPLFYGWGLGWAGHVRGPACLALALAILAIELALCRLWLSRFRFGPLEWVWRTLVYLKPQPMRLAPRHAAAIATAPADS